MTHENKTTTKTPGAAVHELSRLTAVRAAVATLHVDTPAAGVVVAVLNKVSGLGYRSTAGRDLFYFAAACVVRHRLNVAGYHAAVYACRRAGGAS